MPIGTVSIQGTSWVPPVGMCVTLGVDTSPAQLWANTSWVQIKDGFLMGASDTYPLGSTGGAWEHTLTVEEMPAHTHTATIENAGEHEHTFGTYTGSDSPISGTSIGNGMWPATANSDTTSKNGAHTHTVTAGSAGEDEAFSILNPYATKNVWQRVA